MRLTVPVPRRWADLDAYGHVNNVQVTRLLEEARIAAFWRHGEVEGDRLPTAVLDAGPTATTHTVVARQEVEYLRPVPYRPRPVSVHLWLGGLGGASVEVCYEVTEPDDDVVLVRAETTLVLLDAATGRPRRVGEAERAVWEPYLEGPVGFRRRRG